MSVILWNGNLYTTPDVNVEAPRLDEFTESTTTGQTNVITIRVPWSGVPEVEQNALPLTPQQPQPIPTPGPVPVPIVEPPPPAVVETAADPIQAVPEPSALFLVGPGLALVFYGYRRSR